jgi:hypothetical protein
MEAGLAADQPVTVAAKRVRLKLLKVKADLERELGKLASTARAAVRRSTGSRASVCPTLGVGGTAIQHLRGSRFSSG